MSGSWFERCSSRGQLASGDVEESVRDDLRERFTVQGVKQRVQSLLDVVYQALLLWLNCEPDIFRVRPPHSVMEWQLTGVVCFKWFRCSLMISYMGRKCSGM